METGAVEAGCIRCGRTFLPGARFCYHCGGSRAGLSPDLPAGSGGPAPMTLGRLLAAFLLAALAAVTLSVGGCFVALGLSEKNWGPMAAVGLPVLAFGMAFVYALVRVLR